MLGGNLHGGTKWDEKTGASPPTAIGQRRTADQLKRQIKIMGVNNEPIGTILIIIIIIIRIGYSLGVTWYQDTECEITF